MLIAVIISAVVVFALVGLVTRLTPWWGAILLSLPLTFVLSFAAFIAVSTLGSAPEDASPLALVWPLVAGVWATVRYSRKDRPQYDGSMSRRERAKLDPPRKRRDW